MDLEETLLKLRAIQGNFNTRVKSIIRSIPLEIIPLVLIAGISIYELKTHKIQEYFVNRNNGNEIQVNFGFDTPDEGELVETAPGYPNESFTLADGRLYPPQYRVYYKEEGQSNNFSPFTNYNVSCVGLVQPSGDPCIKNQPFHAVSPYPELKISIDGVIDSSNHILTFELPPESADGFRLRVYDENGFKLEWNYDIYVNSDGIRNYQENQGKPYVVKFPLNMWPKRDNGNLTYIDGQIFDSSGNLLWDNGTITDAAREIESYNIKSFSLKFMHPMRQNDRSPIPTGVASGLDNVEILGKDNFVIEYLTYQIPSFGEEIPFTFWCLNNDEPDQKHLFEPYKTSDGSIDTSLQCENATDGAISTWTGQHSNDHIYFFATSKTGKHFTIDDLVARIWIYGTDDRANNKPTGPVTFKFTAWTWNPDDSPAEKRISQAYVTAELDAKMIEEITHPQEIRLDLRTVFSDLPAGTIFEQIEMEFVNGAPFSSDKGMSQEDVGMFIGEFKLYHKAEESQGYLPFEWLFGGLLKVWDKITGGRNNSKIANKYIIQIQKNVSVGSAPNEDIVYLGKTEFRTGTLFLQVENTNIKYKIDLFKELGRLDVINDYYGFPEKFSGKAGLDNLRSRIGAELSDKFYLGKPNYNQKINFRVALNSNLYQWLNINRYKIEPPERRQIMLAPVNAIVPYEEKPLAIKDRLNIGHVNGNQPDINNLILYALLNRFSSGNSVPVR